MINTYTEVNKIALGIEELEVLKFTTGFLKDYHCDHLEMSQAVSDFNLLDVMYTVTVDSRAKGTGNLYRHIIIIKEHKGDFVLDEIGVFRRVYDKETGQVSFKEEEATS